MLNIKIVSVSLGLFGVVTFVLCVAYGLVVPPALHMSVGLEILLPGFAWISAGSFFLGLAESFLYGAYAGIVFVPIYNAFQRRWGVRPAAL